MFTEEIELFLEEYKANLAKGTDHFIGELAKTRAGRANPKMVEHVRVDYYGTPTPLYQMATISVPDARTLMISPWDASAIRNVLKGLDEANLGLTPSDDGKNIRLSFPPLTEERRRELIKDIAKLAEAARVTCRNARRDVLDEFKTMKKDSQIAEDAYERLEKDVQKILDDAIKNIDQLLSNKEKDLLEI